MKINGVSINSGVIWEDETTSAKSTQQLTTLISGNINIVHSKIQKPTMTFEAKENGAFARGYFTREMTEFLLNAEANLEQFVIEYRGVEYPVIIPSGGVQLTPKRETEETALTDVYCGTLTVQVV